MAVTVSTGWRLRTPGVCLECGSEDDWHEDGRGFILCGCQACPDCGELSAENFHAADCPQLDEEWADDDREDGDDDDS
jgi:hypothetical protein